MKISAAALITASVVSGLHARPVHAPPIKDLWAMADLVAVIEPISTSAAGDLLTYAGPKYGPRDPENYQAFETKCRVVLVMKSQRGNTTEEEQQLTVLHFGQKRGIEHNGGLFVYFLLPPTNIVTCIAPEVQPGGGPPLESMAGRYLTFLDRPSYLAFLSAMPDGRYRAATGDYDAEPSFRFLTKPTSGHMLHALTDHGRGLAPK